MVALLRWAITGYQRALGPALKWVATGNPRGSLCRFEPTCSAYFLEAVERHGAWRGSGFGLRRLLRCHPWGGCGCDPVPPVRTELREPPRESRETLS